MDNGSRFDIGVIKELIFPPVRRGLMLYEIDAIFVYTAAAFSYPYHSDTENNEEET